VDPVQPHTQECVGSRADHTPHHSRNYAFLAMAAIILRPTLVVVCSDREDGRRPPAGPGGPAFTPMIGPDGGPIGAAANGGRSCTGGRAPATDSGYANWPSRRPARESVLWLCAGAYDAPKEARCTGDPVPS
jgi:hypothetical protein